MDIYKSSFGVLAILNCLLGYTSSRSDKSKPEESSDIESSKEMPVRSSKEAIKFQLSFFLVYTIIVAADWLQVSALFKVLGKLELTYRAGTVYICTIQGREKLVRSNCSKAFRNRLHCSRRQRLIRGRFGRSLWSKICFSMFLWYILCIVRNHDIQQYVYPLPR